MTIILISRALYTCRHRRRPGAELGGTEKISQTKISEWRFFREKFPFSSPKFLMTIFFFFLIIGHIFQIFRILFQIFRIFRLLCEISYMTHSSREKLIFHKTFPWWHLFNTLFVLSRASNNTTSQNIGGRMHGPYPHLNFFGGRPPVPFRSPPMHVGPCNRNLLITFSY